MPGGKQIKNIVGSFIMSGTELTPWLDEKSQDEMFEQVRRKLRTDVEYACQHETEQHSNLTKYILERVQDMMMRLRARLGRPPHRDGGYHQRRTLSRGE